MKEEKQIEMERLLNVVDKKRLIRVEAIEKWFGVDQEKIERAGDR